MKAGLLLAMLIAIATTRPSNAAPLEAYGRLPTLGLVRISPDGLNLASVVTSGEDRKLIIQASDLSRTLLQLDFGTIKLRELQWAGPNHLIATYSQTSNLEGLTAERHEFFQALDIDLKQKTYRPLLWNAPNSLNVIYGLPVVRFIGGRPVAFVEGTTLFTNGSALSLFRIDMQAGVSKIQTPGFLDTTDFVVSADGRTVAQAEYDVSKSRWSIDVWKGRWAEVDHTDAPIGTPQLEGLGRDGVSIAVAFGEGDEGVIDELKPDGSVWGEPFPAPDPDRLIWDSATHKLIGKGALRGDVDSYRFFDPADQAAWAHVVSGFPGARVALESFTDDHQKFAVRVDEPTTGPAFFLSDIAANRTIRIGSEYSALDPDDIASVRSITFKAGDGLVLGGYLTQPRGAAVQPLPLVVLVHGGPAARDEPGFDWWAQAIASRGYAVLQVNFRGSDGLGQALLSAGYGQWGRKMQTDLSDGVRFLAAQGVVDPARVCIVGASYGGYAALAGAAIDRGVYRCAASVAGPADLRVLLAKLKKEEGNWSAPGQRYWLRYMGDVSNLDEISPARQAQNVAIPVLLIHGKDDTVVPFNQSQIMADALRKAGKDVEFVTLKKEDHWLSHSETRLQMLQSVMTFLVKNNPPGVRASATSAGP